MYRDSKPPYDNYNKGNGGYGSSREGDYTLDRYGQQKDQDSYRDSRDDVNLGTQKYGKSGYGDEGYQNRSGGGHNDGNDYDRGARSNYGGDKESRGYSQGPRPNNEYGDRRVGGGYDSEALPNRNDGWGQSGGNKNKPYDDHNTGALVSQEWGKAESSGWGHQESVGRVLKGSSGWGQLEITRRGQQEPSGKPPKGYLGWGQSEPAARGPKEYQNWEPKESSSYNNFYSSLPVSDRHDSYTQKNSRYDDRSSSNHYDGNTHRNDQDRHRSNHNQGFDRRDGRHGNNRGNSYGDEKVDYGGKKGDYGDMNHSHGNGRDNYGGSRDNYGGSRDNYGESRDNYDGGRYSYGGSGDIYGDGGDAYGGGRDGYRGGMNYYGGKRDNFGGGGSNAYNSKNSGYGDSRGRISGDDPSYSYRNGDRVNDRLEAPKVGWASSRKRYEWDEEKGEPGKDDIIEEELFGDKNHVNSGINFKKYREVQVQVKGNGPDPVTKFKDAKLHPIMTENIRLAKYDEPTPVQSYTIPIVLDGLDLMACAQTGSGKTAAFLIPILSRLFENPPSRDAGEIVNQVPTHWAKYDHSSSRRPSRSCSPSVLILAPTRELSVQIFEEACRFCYQSKLRPCVVYGGSSSQEQLKQLRMGCDILTGTPGRLNDFVSRGNISLKRLQFLVIDEADRMLEMGFENQLREILGGDCPKASNRQTLLFSATFPKEIRKLTRDFMRNYLFLAVGRIGGTTSNITQAIEYVEDRDKRDKLIHILMNHPPCKTLIFMDTKRSADTLDDFLFNKGMPCTSIHGDRTQAEREDALMAFKTDHTPLLIATSVAARGLDIKDVLHVINYELPKDIDEYVHRIGRTARAGNTGLATSFFNRRNESIATPLAKLLKESKQSIPDFLLEFSGPLDELDKDDNVPDESEWQSIQNSYDHPANDSQRSRGGIYDHGGKWGGAKQASSGGGWGTGTSTNSGGGGWAPVSKTLNAPATSLGGWSAAPSVPFANSVGGWGAAPSTNSGRGGWASSPKASVTSSNETRWGPLPAPNSDLERRTIAKDSNNSGGSNFTNSHEVSEGSINWNNAPPSSRSSWPAQSIKDGEAQREPNHSTDPSQEPNVQRESGSNPGRADHLSPSASPDTNNQTPTQETVAHPESLISDMAQLNISHQQDSSSRNTSPQPSSSESPKPQSVGWGPLSKAKPSSGR